MQENYVLVQKGFRLLHSLMAEFIGTEMQRVFQKDCQKEIYYILKDQEQDLPTQCSYTELINSLDIANCIRIIDREWNDVFRQILKRDCKTWVKELMGVRNSVSHRGNEDMKQSDAERALDTMVRLYESIDASSSQEIKDIYLQIRKQDILFNNDTHNGPIDIDVPITANKKYDRTTRNLMDLIGSEYVQKTNITRKVTFKGKTQAYPVYKVRLDLLYYNDQNDRIATWITRYKAENGDDSLNDLETDDYNDIIENFIYESNPESIVKTQKNISLIGQKEAGVALSDGRIVDGNRRYTCLRRIDRAGLERQFFETVIMDVDIQKDKKAIKLLELSIQHGEEKKVDYDLIDYAIGTYTDVEKTKLLSLEEYASSTNESIADVKKRIDIASIICEFLSYLRLPEQYHVARDYQVYSIFQEMLPALKQVNKNDKERLKTIVFNNILTKALVDQRKFIRDIKLLIKNDTYSMYFDEQAEIIEQIQSEYKNVNIQKKEDIDSFSRNNATFAEQLQLSLEKALLRSRRQKVKEKPIENIIKCTNLLTDVDIRVFEKLDETEKQSLVRELEHLSEIISEYTDYLKA